MTECFEKNLRGSSSHVDKVRGIESNFDLFIHVVGWESRCTEILNYDKGKFSFSSALVLSFRFVEGKGYDDDYMNKIKSFLEKRVNRSEIHFIEDEPTNFEKITKSIDMILINLVKKLKRPLYIGFDMTSCPRYFFLYILGFCIRHEIAKQITFFYCEGRYKVGDIENYVHTKGEWSLISIPKFEGLFNPENDKFFLVSVGFEGKRYRSFTNKYEPDKVGILVPVPGFNESYTKKVCAEYKPMIDDFKIKAEEVIECSAGDAIAVWTALKNPILNDNKYQISYLTFGPKPHVLGMGLHALMNDNITVTYRVPESYTKIDVESTGVFWKYVIENLIFG